MKTKTRVAIVVAVVLVVVLDSLVIARLVAGLQTDEAPQQVAASGISAMAHDDRIDLTVRGVGGSGTAQLLRYEANAYHGADPLKGVVAQGSQGELVGEYTCGRTQVFRAPRKSDDGHDYLYSKYYVVQDGQILAGPCYATGVDAPDRSLVFETKTKKGGSSTHGTTNSKTPGIVADLGCAWANATVDLGALLVKNENADGSPVDAGIYDDTTSFTYEGTVYHFKNKGLKKYDAIIKGYTKCKVNVQVILLCYKTHGDWKSYPQALSYVGSEGFPSTGNFWSGESIGYNTATETGEKYFLAAMEFLAQRWSQDEAHGLVHNFVVGNEIDWAFAWQHVASWHLDEQGRTVYETLPLDTYMEEMARTMRLSNLAVKKYNSNMTVSISFTNQWAQSYATSCKYSEYDYGFDTYAPKDQLDWLFAHETARGDYDWGLAMHPYANNGIEGPDVFYWELKNLEEGGISTDFNTSAHLSPANFEILESYLERSVARYDGQLRTVRLTEVQTSAGSGSEEELAWQAGYLAWEYYRYALLPCVQSIEYWPVVNYPIEGDSKARVGLMDNDAKTTRPAYEVWKYIDTNKSFEYADKYLPYLSYERDGTTYSVQAGTISSYEDIVDFLGSGYDWESAWRAWGITPRRADM